MQYGYDPRQGDPMEWEEAVADLMDNVLREARQRQKDEPALWNRWLDDVNTAGKARNMQNVQGGYPSGYDPTELIQMYYNGLDDIMGQRRGQGMDWLNRRMVAPTPGTDTDVEDWRDAGRSDRRTKGFGPIANTEYLEGFQGLNDQLGNVFTWLKLKKYLDSMNQRMSTP